MKKENQIKEQIRFMAKKWNKTEDEAYVNYVYALNLPSFSGETMKNCYNKYIELNLNTLEMQLEYFDEIGAIQDTIHYVSVLMKDCKNKELQERFDNLIKHFRKVYLNEG